MLPLPKTEDISFVQFGTLTAAEWAKYSVAEISHPAKGSDFDRGVSMANSPYDGRMGMLGTGCICETCGNTNIVCPGHFGYIKLALPVFNPMFFLFVLKILRCVCVGCGKCRIKSEVAKSIGALKYKGFDRLKFLVKKCEKKKSKMGRCYDLDCNAEYPSFKMEGKGNANAMGFIAVYTHKSDSGETTEKIRFTAKDTLGVLEKIDRKTFRLLGFNNNLSDRDIFKDPAILTPEKKHIHEIVPSSLIFNSFPVIPPTVRPWISRDGEKRDDDLTSKYNDIIKANNKLANLLAVESSTAENNAARESTIESVYFALQMNVNTLIDNHKESDSNNRPIRGLDDRLRGKGGHGQGHAVAKRVDYSARSVIVGGGPYIEAGEVGTSEYIAKNLTVPEPVTPFTIDELRKIVENDEANYIRRNGATLNIKYMKKKGPIVLKMGDIVERHLRDGDFVVFNRQPTLRLESMQCKKVRVLKGTKVFRLSLAETTPYNADFDGDEMNMHVPQSVDARVDCMRIMGTDNLIVSNQSNTPIIGLVQDALLAIYILTFFDTMVKKSLFEKCMKAAKIPEKSINSLLERALEYYPEYIIRRQVGTKKKPTLTIADTVPGKLFISVLFPEDFHFKAPSIKVDGTSLVVTIQNGVILPTSGPLTKMHVGNKQCSVIHRLWLEYSPTVALDFITAAQFLTDNWFQHHGFSIGISDCMCTEECNTKIDEQLRQLEKESETILQTVTDPEERENLIKKAIQNTSNTCSIIVGENMNKGSRNAINVMRNCGAKGNIINCTQIAGYVGQQSIEGGRIPASLGGRCTSHFKVDDNSLIARGNVKHNYLKGLTPAEVYFHAYGGRKGVTDTSVKTSETGYMQKRMGRKLEDSKLLIDGTVRDGSGRIVQFLYGNDGFDPKKLFSVEGIPFPFFVDPQRVAKRLISHIRHEGTAEKSRHLKPEEIDLVCNSIYVGDPHVQTTITDNSSLVFQKYLRICLQKVKIPQRILPEFCKEIFNAFQNARGEYGSAVGMNAAISIGEPTTQLTLNTFHYAGSTEKDVTLGVPRLNECMNATLNPSTPSCKVFFKDDRLKPAISAVSAGFERSGFAGFAGSAMSDAEIVTFRKTALIALQSHRSDLEHLTVGMFILDSELMYVEYRSSDGTVKVPQSSPVNFIPHKAYIKEWWGNLYDDVIEKISPSERIQPKKWVIRLKMSVEKMFKRNITLDNIIAAIYTSHSDIIRCVPSPLNLGLIDVYVDFDELEQHVREKLKNTNVCNPQNFAYFIARDVVIKYLSDVFIQGVPGIQKVIPYENPETKVWYYLAKILRTKKKTATSKLNNFRDILSLPNVDTTLTISNDMWEIYSTLGIEAVRTFLIEEFTSIIGFDGVYINPRHIELLIDSMTHMGDITGVRRDGIGRDVGPISKGMFEKSTQNFAQSSMFSEKDGLNGLSSWVFYGLNARIGSGAVSVRAVKDEKM